MIRRFNHLIGVILIVAFALYIVIMNREPVTVYMSSKNTFTTSSGVALIVVYVLGVLTSALVALVFGIKFSWRERKLQQKEKQRQQFLQAMLQARGYLVSEEWSRAQELWEQSVRRDPTDIIARVELSRCLQGAGDYREALKVLDDARAVDPANLEVLFRAAELNLDMNNRTAAIDNLALVLNKHPNARAARMARDLSEELDRIEDALDYHAQYENLEDDESSAETLTRLRFKKLLKDHTGEQLEPELRAFIKKHPDFAPALQKFAEISALAGNADEAAELLIRAGKATGQPSYWWEAANLWLKFGMPDRAVSAARAATHSTEGKARFTAELNLIKLYIGLNMIEDARKSLDNFETMLRKELSLPREIMQSYFVLKGLCFNRLGMFSESAQVWRRLSEYDYSLENTVAIEHTVSGNGSAAPSPSLSTP